MSVLFYSHRRRFIFIHVIKTGGNSIRKALIPYARWPGAPVDSSWTRLRARLGLLHLRDRFGLTTLQTRLGLPARAGAHWQHFIRTRPPPRCVRPCRRRRLGDTLSLLLCGTRGTGSYPGITTCDNPRNTASTPSFPA